MHEVSQTANFAETSGPSCSKGGYLYPMDKMYILQPIHFTCRLATYLLDKVICSLNNGGLMCKGNEDCFVAVVE